jgi:hypothetical protein
MSGFRAIVGDRGRPLFDVLKTGEGTPVDLASSTVTFTMALASSPFTVKVNAQAATVHPTQTFTTDTTNKILKAVDNKAQDGDQIVMSNSGGALPAEYAAATRYFVREWGPNGFKVSLLANGPVIDPATAGTGTHSFYIVGSVSRAWEAADVDTAGDYSGHWQETVGGLVRSYPVSSDGIKRGFPVEFRAL